MSRERAREGAAFVLDEGEPVGVVEKPDEPPSTLVPLGVFVFAPRVFEALRQVAPSDRGEYELAGAVDRLFGGGGGVELVRLDGWLTNVNTVADIEWVEGRIGGGGDA